jgi:hypothetical protein
MKKLILGLSLILSTSVFADYIVYPQGGVKSVAIPEPGCKSKVSELEDGFYILCSQDDGLKYPVVDGQAFRLSKTTPSKAFTCPLGYALSNDTNKGYAFDSEAMKLSSMSGKNVYTPYYSHRPYFTSNAGMSKGLSTYYEPDGTRNSTFVNTSSYLFGSPGTQYCKLNRGTSKTLIGKTCYLTGPQPYSSRIPSTLSPAYRACLIE